MTGQLSLESIEYTRATMTKSEPTIDPSADNAAANERESPAGWDAHEVKRRILAQGAALGFDKLAVTDTALSKEAPHVLSWMYHALSGAASTLATASAIGRTALYESFSTSSRIRERRPFAS